MLFGYEHGENSSLPIASLSFSWPRTTITAIWGSCLFYLLLQAAPVHSLDPNKHLTQYIHTSWRIQDGSAPSADMLSIAQTSDGFLWFVAAGGLFRFDGVRFVPWALPATVSMHQIANVFGDRSGGLWVVGENEIVDLKGGIVSSRFELRGVQSTQNISEDPDGSLWVVRSSPSSFRLAPLPCHAPGSEVFR